MSNKTNTTIDFTLLDTENSDGNLELDTAYNTQIYGEERTVFESKEIAYLRLLTGGIEVDYNTLTTSLGKVKVVNTGILYDIEETIQFVCSNEGKLSNNPHKLIEYSWIGNDKGVPSFIKNKIKLLANTSGLLKVNYTAIGDRIALSEAELEEEEYDVLVSLCIPKCSLIVKFQNSSIGDLYLKIVVRDICSGEPIPNATVIIENFGEGVTDDKGVLTFPKTVKEGATFNIKTVAANYTPSDKDFISNDSFVVPAPANAGSSLGELLGLGSDISCPYLKDALEALL